MVISVCVSDPCEEDWISPWESDLGDLCSGIEQLSEELADADYVDEKPENFAKRYNKLSDLRRSVRKEQKELLRDLRELAEECKPKNAEILRQVGAPNISKTSGLPRCSRLSGPTRPGIHC